MKVLARATPEDKLLLVCGIRKKSGNVGMTGEGISDAQALEASNVGFCMGTGCDVAKDQSDLIVRDN